MTHVVRVGNSVRRTSGPWTPTVHAFMRHLRASGFERVPEPLGIDELGREIISFLPGAIADYPLPEFAWSHDTLVAVARFLRDFHDASLGFIPPADVCWRWPAHRPAEVICHNDFAPYNLMFEDGQLTAVIDLDLVSPGPRVWDIAYTAYRFVPLTDPANPDTLYPGVDAQKARLADFCATYGDRTIEPAEVLEFAAAYLRELVAFIEREALAGDPAQAAVLARGDVDIYVRDIAYIEQLAQH